MDLQQHVRFGGFGSNERQAPYGLGVLHEQTQLCPWPIRKANQTVQNVLCICPP